MSKNHTRLSKILDSTIAKICASAALVVILAVCGWVKRSFLSAQIARITVWLKEEHSLTEPGWRLLCWFSLPFVCSLLIFLLWRWLRRSSKYSRKETIIKILAEWVTNNNDDLQKGKLVRFREIDIGKNLRRGSTGKHLKTVIDKCKKLQINFVDKDTAYVSAEADVE